jgi:hypothetical protein
VPLGQRVLSVFATSRHLPAYPWGEAWARQVWGSYLSGWVLDGSDQTVLVPSGHGWALDMAERTKCSWVELGADGVRRSSDEPERRWAPDTVHPHAVAEALVEAARAARHQRWEVEVLVLRVEERRHDDGLGRLVRLARSAGFEVDECSRRGLELVAP